MSDPDATRHGLYLHIPFCKSVCPYCDFAVQTGGAVRRRKFVDLLLAEIDMRRGYEGCFDTIYIGGGTPSILGAEQLAQILERIQDVLDVSERPDFHLEANPEDVKRELLESWLDLGVTFLSLGVQSFDEKTLRFLGRNHTANQARSAVDLAKASGFETVSIDLIYGLPSQNVESWENDLQAAVELEPDHLSCYQLTVHRNTPFGVKRSRGQLQELGEEVQGEQFDLTHRFLSERGYPGYEVSSFASSVDHESRHNRKYWDHTPYLGVGPSAHSYASTRRWWNVRSVKLYAERVATGRLPIQDGEDLTLEDLRFESLMLGLRTAAGIDLDLYRERWGLDLRARNGDVIEQLVQEGRLSVQDRRLIPSESGWAIADRLALQFDIGDG